MHLHPLLAKGILLGLGAAVPIGPVNVEIARRTLRGGFRAGFALGCGAVSVDVTYAILSSLGFAAVVHRVWVRQCVTLAGALLLAWLGAMSLRGALRELRQARAGQDRLAPATVLRGPARAYPTAQAYLTGVLMTLSNPMTLAFWALVVPAAAATRITQEAGGDLPMICAGVFIGTVGWVISFAGLLALAGRYRRAWWLAAADAAGGATLLAFAAGAVAAFLHPPAPSL